MKKAELSLNVIVMAVIAILILVILSYIVLNGTQNYNRGIEQCSTACVVDGAECTAQGYRSSVPMSCPLVPGNPAAGTGNACCILPQ